MMRREFLGLRICAVATLVLGLGVSVGVAEPAAKDIAARTELHAIQTLTLSDKQFLIGDAEAKATVLSAELRLAQGSGRLPLVVLMHGSGGMGANIEMWAREFNAIGISTFAIDGFTGRGLTQTSTNQALLGRLNFILDIYRGRTARSVSTPVVFSRARSQQICRLYRQKSLS
jgi:hypothetical protein